MLRGYGGFYTVLTTVRDATITEFQRIGALPKRVGVVPGAIAWDGCEQCGLLALAAQRYYLTDQFPIEVATTDMKQGAFVAADLVTQIIRCAPTGQNNDLAPSVEALDASAKQVLDDAYAVLCATTTELDVLLGDNSIVDYMVRQQIFMGPEGMCVGSELSYAVALMR